MIAQPSLFAPVQLVPSSPATPWHPEQVYFTKSALEQPFGAELHARLEALNVPITALNVDRLPSIQGLSDAELYRRAKRTLAVVVAPPSQFRLQPIPPSADYQFHLAQGCPAHCQYCYLAGSLSGPPITRVYANLPEILENLRQYATPGKVTTFEASCYTDPLALEHLTGSLSKTIRYFGQAEGMVLRFVSKFDAVDGLLSLDHRGHTRARISLNVPGVTQQLEGGTASLEARLSALGRLSAHGYPVGAVVAPIIPVLDWQAQYTGLLERIAGTLQPNPDLTLEFITHRYTERSKGVLEGWYPNSALDMTDTNRARKRNAFGGEKMVFDKPTMYALKTHFLETAQRLLPNAKVLYWT